MARQWTLIQCMAARVQLKTQMPWELALMAMVNRGFDKCPNIKQSMPIFAQLIEEMRRLEQLDKVES